MNVQTQTVEWALERLPRVEQDLYHIRRKLSNETFVDRAPTNVLEYTREKEATLQYERDYLFSLLDACVEYAA